MSDENPFSTPEFKAYATRAMTELVPMMQGSALAVAMVPTGEVDVKFAIELGFMVMMDKPILVLCPPGKHISGKLRAIADEIVESEPGRPEFEELMMAAVRRLQERFT